MSDSVDARRSVPALWVLVAAIALVGLALRLRGIDYQLPHVTHLDGSVLVRQVADMRYDPEHLARGKSFYPHLVARMASLSPDPGRTEPQPELGLEGHLRLASAHWREVRVLSAVVSILMVPATFALARGFLSAGWSLFAAALVASSLLHGVFTTQVRPHGTASTFILLAVLAALRLRRRGDVAAYLLAGAAAGLALGALHYGVFALPPIAVALLLRRRSSDGPDAPGTRGRASAWWILATLAIVALCVRALYPFHFEGGRGYLSLENRPRGMALNLSGQPLFLEKFTGEGFAVVPETLWSYDPLLFAATLAGLGALLVRRLRGAPRASPERRRDLWVVLAHALPYLLVIGLYAETWERFVLQLLPYAACLAAVGTSALLGLAQAGAWVRAAVACLLLAFPALTLAKLGSVRRESDTSSQAAEWVRENLSQKDRILALPYIDLPLFHGEQALVENGRRSWSSSWVRYQRGLSEGELAGPRHEYFLPIGEPQPLVERLVSDPLGYFHEHEADYAVVRDPAGAQDSAHLVAVRDALREHSSLVGRLSPREDGGGAGLPAWRIAEAEWSRPFVRRLWSVRRMGPAIEIYALRR